MVREPAPRRWRLLPLAAGLLFAALALDAARTETPTIDEFAHVAVAHALLDQGRLDLYSKSPPLGRALLALPSLLDARVKVPVVRESPFGWGPWRYGERFMRANAQHYFEIFTRSRAVVVLLTLLTAGLLFAWSRELFGERGAALATSLFLLQPSVLAHGHLATLDMASTASIFASAWMLRWACARASWGRLVPAGAVWGLALLVKFTAVLLVPAYLALVAWHARRPGRALAQFALLFGVAIATVNLGMGFQGSFARLGDYRFSSSFGRTLKSWLPDATPVPLPVHYVRGFDAQKVDVEHGEFPSYSLGHWSQDGVWYYEILALLLKTPLPMLALLAALPFALWRRPPPRRELAFLLLPLLTLGLLLTAFNALNVGIRYLLPLYPFAFVLLAGLFDGADAKRARVWRTAGLAALSWHVASALWVHPDYLAYFNLAAGGPSQGSRYLLDSNFDWGQDLYRLRPALTELGVEGPIALLYFGHVDPRLYGVDYRIAPREPFEGIVAASVSYVKGFAYPVTGRDGRLVAVRGDHLAWLAGREPVRKLGSIWLYDTRAEASK
jgi:4-amino-4-deoxy-L-arabinose transferase-like glycosyltransferase